MRKEVLCALFALLLAEGFLPVQYSTAAAVEGPSVPLSSMPMADSSPSFGASTGTTYPDSIPFSVAAAEHASIDAETVPAEASPAPGFTCNECFWFNAAYRLS